MPFLQGSMFVDLTNDGQGLRISIASAPSLSKGMQAQQAQIILFLLKICLSCFQQWPACPLRIHADTPGICIGHLALTPEGPHIQSCKCGTHTCTSYGPHILHKLLQGCDPSCNYFKPNDCLLVDLQAALSGPHKLLLLRAEEGASAAGLLKQQRRMLQDHSVRQDSAATSAKPCKVEH